MLLTFSIAEADNTEAGADVRGDRWLENFSYLYSLTFIGKTLTDILNPKLWPA